MHEFYLLYRNYTYICDTHLASLCISGIKKVEASMYEPYVKEVFGTQTISSMQLCHMEKKRKDGYYLVEHEVFFNK